MNLYTGSEMTKELTKLYEGIGNPAIKGNEAAAAQQASERSQALYTMTADNNAIRNVMWTITFDTPIVDKSKPLDYVAGMQGTGVIGGRTNIMTGYADNFIDNESSKFQAVAVKEKYTAKVGGSFDATPANYVTNKAGTPEFPNNYPCGLVFRKRFWQTVRRQQVAKKYDGGTQFEKSCKNSFDRSLLRLDFVIP